MNSCPKCAGKWEEWRGECPFCKSDKARKLGQKPAPVRLSKDERVYNLYPSMVTEYEKVKELKPPLSFTRERIDTPESLAAKRQLEISKGIDVPNY